MIAHLPPACQTRCELVSRGRQPQWTSPPPLAAASGGGGPPAAERAVEGEGFRRRLSASPDLPGPLQYGVRHGAGVPVDAGGVDAKNRHALALKPQVPHPVAL